MYIWNQNLDTVLIKVSSELITVHKGQVRLDDTGEM